MPTDAPVVRLSSQAFESQTVTAPIFDLVEDEDTTPQVALPVSAASAPLFHYPGMVHSRKLMLNKLGIQPPPAGLVFGSIAAFYDPETGLITRYAEDKVEPTSRGNTNTAADNKGPVADSVTSLLQPDTTNKVDSIQDDGESNESTESEAQEHDHEELTGRCKDPDQVDGEDMDNNDDNSAPLLAVPDALHDEAAEQPELELKPHDIERVVALEK